MSGIRSEIRKSTKHVGTSVRQMVDVKTVEIYLAASKKIYSLLANQVKLYSLAYVA